MCNCSKNTAPAGAAKQASTPQAQAAADRAKAVAAARAANPSTTRMGPTGSTIHQTFSLGDRTFGSDLERAAYLARNGG